MATPGVPTDFAVCVNGSKVELSWKAATTGDTATEYEILRGATAAKLEHLATVAASKTTHEDTPPAPGPYSYGVVAKIGPDKSAATAALDVIVVAPAVNIWIGLFAGYVALVVVGIWALFVLVPFPTIAAPSDHLDSVSGAVGAYLVRFGIVLVIAAFVVALVEQLARTFKITFERPRTRAPGEPTINADAIDPASGLAQVILGTLAALPELLRRPAGYGIAIILLGVVLLIGASFGFKDAAPGASPGPGSAAPSAAAPTP
ncbi:MAG TPA: hypothetical protein VGQ85_00555 [Candidatus Limnocylindrales bacterium]|nr:hypothetical protein [Candidatus Limnocylindrales bacterium]